MDRRPYWPALPGILVGLVFVGIGATQLIPMLSIPSGAPLLFQLFPILWIGIALLITIQNVLIFLRGPRSRYGMNPPSQYPMGQDPAWPNQGYIKDDLTPAQDSPPSPSARLLELDEMRRNSLITLEEYNQKKAEILREL